jgi:GNAT superfamily N-acetyltransferase
VNKLRQATLEDFEEVYPILLSWIRELGSDGDRDSIFKQYSLVLKNGPGLLLEVDGKIAAMIGISIHSLEWLNKKYLAEQYLYVVPEYRGKGVFKELMSHVENFAKLMGCSEIILSPTFAGSMDPNIAKRGMEKLGYDFFGYVMRKGV